MTVTVRQTDWPTDYAICIKLLSFDYVVREIGSAFGLLKILPGNPWSFLFCKASKPCSDLNS